jgi:hypothetical protein
LRLRRIGRLKDTTKAQIEALEDEIEKREKVLTTLKFERTQLLRRLEEED